MKFKNFFAFILIALLIMLTSVCGAFADNESNNIVIVFDDSGSMSNNLGGISKIDAAKIALSGVLKDIPEKTNVGLVSFHRGWLYDLQPVNKVLLERAINSITPDGGTPLSRYIKMGADRLLEQRKLQLNYGTYRLLVATDGEPSDFDYSYKEYTPEIMARGITFDVIGVGMESEHDLATRVHTYYNADDPNSLKLAVKKVFAEIGSKESGVSNEESFEMIAALPDGFAEAVIKALSVTANHPIGTEPEEPKTPKEKMSFQGVSQSSSSNDDGLFPVLIAGAAIVIVAIIFILIRS